MDLAEETSPGDAPKVRKWKRIPWLTEPTDLPAHILRQLPSPPMTNISPTFSLLSSLNDSQSEGSSPSVSPLLGSPFASNLRSLGDSTQPRLRRPQTTENDRREAKFARMDDILRDSGFTSVGELLETLFYNPSRNEPDPRTNNHARSVAHFLQGRNEVRMSDIIRLIYEHRRSSPSSKSVHVEERDALFSPLVSPSQIHHARPSLFTWATELVAQHVHHEVRTLTLNAPDSNGQQPHPRASTNGRSENAPNLITWDRLGEFSIEGVAKKYKECAPVSYYITESMAASKKNGVFVLKQRRPYPFALVSALSSFVVTRNQYATGDIALPLAVWHFATQSHTDVKRVYSRFGNIASDTTARNALNTMSQAGINKLQKSIRDATERNETKYALLFDNIQALARDYEGGLLNRNVMMVGTAGTAIQLDDCAPGAFELQDHLNRVAQQERKNLTVVSLEEDIDWLHLAQVQAHHFVRVLIQYHPELHSYSKDLVTRFRSSPLAKHRMREGRRTFVQPLGTNAEKETSTQGLARALEDFDTQMGVTVEASEKLLSWAGGDGASYGGILRLKNVMAHLPDNRLANRNRIATPELWHAEATKVNAVAENHFGPATSADPSSLSRSSAAAKFKRPTNLSKCDFYPTTRSMTLIWEAQVLNLWRVFLNVPATSSLLNHLDAQAASGDLPSLDKLLNDASVLVRRYASQDAFEQALSFYESSTADTTMSIPFGTPFVPISTAETMVPQTSDEETATSAHDISLDATPTPTEKPAPKAHTESEGFDGDRVLANSILFLIDYGLLTEMAYAVPEGDIGRVFEVLKVWIFDFAGSSHRNYMSYILEVYCFLRYEASMDLRNAILNNWLVNVTGQLGKWIGRDLQQEHYNRWLEEMVEKHGGDFDNKFYRQTLAPNVEHFLRIKEGIEDAFKLDRRSKTHTSRHLRDEMCTLLNLYKEEELHHFRLQRSLGHAAVNQFAVGYERLQNGKLDEFLFKTTVYADVLTDIQALKSHNSDVEPIEGPDVDEANPSPWIRNMSPGPNGSDDEEEESETESVDSEQDHDTDPDDEEVVDPSNEKLASGSDLHPCIQENGMMQADWFEWNEMGDESDREVDEESDQEVQYNNNNSSDDEE